MLITYWSPLIVLSQPANCCVVPKVACVVCLTTGMSAGCAQCLVCHTVPLCAFVWSTYLFVRIFNVVRILFYMLFDTHDVMLDFLLSAYLQEKNHMGLYGFINIIRKINKVDNNNSVVFNYDKKHYIWR